MTYLCAVCGKTHEGLPDIGFQWPDPYFDVPESERDTRVRGGTDACSIDNVDFFIRGVLLIPVHGQTEQLGLGVWVSQSQSNYHEYLENFDTDEIGPFFGWFSNHLPYYEKSTWALKAKAYFQGNGQRPLIELDPCDHPLYGDVRDGISLEKAWRYVHWHDDTGDA